MPKALCLLLMFIFLFSIAMTAQARDKPDWVMNFGESLRYPQEDYITGFGSSPGKDAEAIQAAKNDARFDASRTIVVDIRGRILTIKEERQQQYSQHLSSITESSTALQLMGLGMETHAEDEPPTTYALAYASKAELKRIYSARRSDLINQIGRILQAAESSSRDMEAAAKYLSLYPLYEELKQAETVLLVVDVSNRIEDAFAELEREVGEAIPDSTQEPLLSWTEVGNRIDQLVSQSPQTVDDVARSVIIHLSRQVGDMSGQLMIVPFTYQDTKMTSSFARYFRSALESQAGQTTNLRWSAVDQVEDFKPRTRESMTEFAKASGAQWLLSGTYWEQEDRVKLMAILRDVQNGRIMAGADVIFDADIIRSMDLKLKPGNYQQAILEQNAFTQGEIVSSKLQVDVFTNRGKDNLLFTEGETMKTYVRVNRPAYVRLLYILADGRRTLLPVYPDTSMDHDSYYIDQSRVNRLVEIPAEFECAPPFGAEMLVVIARTKGFDPIDLVEYNGYYYLEADSPDEAAFKARGLKGMKVKMQKPTDFEQAEAKIVITTMAK